MAQLHKVLVAMAQATQQFKEKDTELMAEHQRKYGIDVSETFSFKYEDDGSNEEAKPASSGGSGGDGGSLDSLMD
jgi:hypothetical protein